MNNIKIFFKSLLLTFCFLVINTQLQAMLLDQEERTKPEKIEYSNSNYTWQTTFAERKPMPWTINESNLNGRKIYQVRYKKDGSYVLDYANKIKVQYCMALTPEKACEECTEFYSNGITLEAVDITDEFSRDNSTKKFLRTSFKELSLSEESNKLLDYQRYYFTPAENDEIYSCPKRLFAIKKGTDPKTVLVGTISERDLAQLTVVTDKFNNEGECTAYRKVYSDYNNNQLLFLPLAWGWNKQKEHPFSFNPATHKIVQTADGYSNFLIPKSIDTKKALAGVLTPDELTTINDITEQFSPQGYKKHPDFNTFPEIPLTIDPATNKTFFGDVELTSFPADCLILKSKDDNIYYATTNNDMKEYYGKNKDKSEFNLTLENNNFNFATGAFKPMPALTKQQINQAPQSLTTPAAPSITENTKKPTTQPAQPANKKTTKISTALQTHRTKLVATTGALTTLGALAIAYKKHQTIARKAKKKPMKLSAFLAHVVQNPRKHPMIFGALGATAIGTTASYLL